jgi:hypothetical protein
MKFVPFDKVNAEDWDKIVHASDDGWAFSLSHWLKMVTPIWKMEHLSFAIEENGKLVALMPLHRIVAEKRLSSSGWGHGGPVIAAGVSAVDRSRLWRACFSNVEKIAAQTASDRITLMISPLTDSSLNNRWGVNPLLEIGFDDVSTHTRIVNLSQLESELWFGLAKDARQKIKKAQVGGYSFLRSSWEEMVDAYYRVHSENYQRTGVTPLPKAYFDGIAAKPETHAVLWVGFSPGGEPVAFHNDARFGSKALYHTGCSETDHLKSGINYLLFWEAMLGAKADGCAWYETGETFPLAKVGKEKGLTDFKKKFGGEIHRFFKGELFLNKSQIESPTLLVPSGGSDLEIKLKKETFRNWMKANSGLSAVIFGKRFTNSIQKIYFKIKGVFRKA